MTDPDRCASRGCKRTLVGKSVIVDRDGRRLCKHHDDRLPPYLRKPQRVEKQKATSA